MIEVKFNVGDEEIRNVFLTRTLSLIINDLDETAPNRWGKMTVHHMIEHLLFTFEISTGKLAAECRTPEKLLPRVKGFLHNNMEMPHDFRNPLLSEDPAEFRFPEFKAAKDALLDEIKLFLGLHGSDPGTIFIHPVFGPLGKEEWERIHFKHSYHHLLQFGMIINPDKRG